MGRDKTHVQELTDEIKENAKKLVERVNLLLKELKIDEVKVSSGWRPPSVNSQVKNAAKKSLHMMGLAIDLQDNGPIKKAILDNLELLEKYDLWLESPDHTPTWCHLDLGIRSKRPRRIFIP
jgi:uncharacterized protein YcbK (DUF882 family)